MRSHPTAFLDEPSSHSRVNVVTLESLLPPPVRRNTSQGNRAGGNGHKGHNGHHPPGGSHGHQLPVIRPVHLVRQYQSSSPSDTIAALLQLEAQLGLLAQHAAVPEIQRGQQIRQTLEHGEDVRHAHSSNAELPHPLLEQLLPRGLLDVERLLSGRPILQEPTNPGELDENPTDDLGPGLIAAQGSSPQRATRYEPRLADR